MHTSPFEAVVHLADGRWCGSGWLEWEGAVKCEPVPVRKLAVTGVVSLLLLAGCGGGTSPSSMSITTESVDPQSIALDPNGKFAYVTNPGSNNVSTYTIDAATGALAAIGSIPAGTAPVSIAVDPAGKLAYVANWTVYDTDGSVSMYIIDATTGVLTPTGTIATGVAPTSIAIHPSGKFAYVTNSGSNSVSMYGIDSATGTLTLIGTIGT